MKKVVIFLFLVFTIGLGGAGFWYWQKNPYSKEVLKLEIIAPKEISTGEEITYVVRYKNNGQVRLEQTTFVFEYPKGAFPSESNALRITKGLEDIYPGQEQSIKFSARLFGKEGDVKEAKALLRYTPKNLTAAYQSETSAVSIISFTPLTFELDLPSRIESGQPLDVHLNYFSNSEYPLSSLRIKMEYPQGFEFQKASPSPIGNDEWPIGVLNKTEGGRISMNGMLRGDLQEVKFFRAVIGIWKEGDFTLLKESVKGVEITKPKLAISQLVNGSSEYIASAGDVLHYEIFFRNVSERNLENLFLLASLEGRPLDLDTVRTEKGRFQKGDNSLIWEARDMPKLRFLGQGEEGKAEFWVQVKGDWEVSSSQEKNFILRSRILLSDAKEEFEIKVRSKLTVEQAGYFQDEVFGNVGLLPPRVGSPTTYTIVWQVKNSYSDIQNGKVKATLPEAVEMTGKIFPENSRLTFDSLSREIVWEVGEVVSGTGTLLPASSVAFQVQLIPMESQKGKVVSLVQEARVIGDDIFTEQSIAAADSPIDTTLADDDTVSPEMGVVQ